MKPSTIKRSGAVALSTALLFAVTLNPVLASPKILVDVESGDVLYSEDASDQWYPASLTKLMTANLAFAAIRDGRATLSTPIVMSSHAASVVPSKLGISPGEGLRLGDALMIMLTRSMNDVATSIAENLAGSEPAFVSMMNHEARRLGMYSSHFSNASGLPDNQQVSTAEDLALLARHILLTYPEYHRYFSIPALTVADRQLKNTNGLIGRFGGADGMKTGYTCASGFNLVATASRNGKQLLSVILGAPSAKTREQAAGNTLEYGFSEGARPTGVLTSSVGGGQPLDMRKWTCGKTYPGFSTTLKKNLKTEASYPASPSEETTEISSFVNQF